MILEFFREKVVFFTFYFETSSSFRKVKTNTELPYTFIQIHEFLTFLHML